MNLEKFTEKTRNIIQTAHSSATAAGHQKLMPEHILKAMLDDSDSIATQIIIDCGGDIAAIYRNLEANLNKIPVISGSGAGQTYLAPETAKLLESVTKIANKAARHTKKKPRTSE